MYACMHTSVRTYIRNYIHINSRLRYIKSINLSQGFWYMICFHWHHINCERHVKPPPSPWAWESRSRPSKIASHRTRNDDELWKMVIYSWFTDQHILKWVMFHSYVKLPKAILWYNHMAGYIYICILYVSIYPHQVPFIPIYLKGGPPS